MGRHSIARLVRDGRWVPLGRGLYLADGRPSWSTWAWAGVRVAGEGSLVGGSAAGHLHQLLNPPAVVDVWVPARPLPRSGDRWRFRLDVEGRRPAPGSLPLLSLEDTVLDLAGELGELDTIDLVHKAMRRTSPGRLRRSMDTRSRVARRSLLASLLEDAVEGVESPLEALYRTKVERVHRLPAASRQHHSTGNRRDVVYLDHGVVVELDGVRWHQERRLRDMRRDNAHQLRGEVTLRYGWHDTFGRACLVAVQVATVLRQRGWTAPFRRCRQCPAP